MLNRRLRVLTATLAVFLILGLTAGAQVAQHESVNLDVVAKIKAEGTERSQVMETLSFMTDVYGPRLTNSPNYKAASEWAKNKLTEWKLQNAHLEAWGPFGRGWTLEGFSANIVKPNYIPLNAHPKAWSPIRDLGASTLTISNTSGTDHLSFDAVGLPGFQFIQDEIEYSSRTHHSNMDVYDRIQADDMKQASVIIASFVYHAAMRVEKLPRKPFPGQQQAAR